MRTDKPYKIIVEAGMIFEREFENLGEGKAWAESMISWPTGNNFNYSIMGGPDDAPEEA